MKALLQRVREARVEIEGRTVGRIGHGLLVFLCAEPEDGGAEVARMAGKIAKLRIFEDEAGKMNRSILDVGGEVLVVSQFTLAADVRKGNRPSFIRAAPPALGESLYERFCEAMRSHGLEVQTGRFGAFMLVHLINEGPVTIWLDTALF